MNTVSRPRLMPNDLLWGAYLLLTLAQLVFAGAAGTQDTLVFAALLAGQVGVLIWNARQPGLITWRFRLAYFGIAMNVAFQQMRSAVPAFRSWRADELLQNIDRYLLGGNLSVAAQGLIRPWLTDFFSGCYMLFFPYLAFSLIAYLFGPLPLARRFYAGLFSLYGLGFIGYTLLPAAGVYLAMPEAFRVPLEGGAITRWNAQLVALGSTRVDVFPSLHVAVSSFILLFDWRHRRWRFWAYLLPCAGLWLSTLYLRYHYFIDLLAGFVLAVLALRIAARYDDRPHASEPS